MGSRIVEVDGKLYRVGDKGMAGSKTYLGKAPKKTKFFDFSITDHLKKTAKNLGMDIK